MKRYSRRQFLVYGSAATGGLIVVACSGSGGGDGGSGGGSASELPDIQGAELITDPSAFPTRFRERPEFRERVERGELDPVELRIGEDPLVLRPIDGIGEYGGTLRRGFIPTEDAPNANNFCAGPDSLLYWDPSGENVVPNLARDFELSPDARELLIHLRRGMRWSNGDPFNADDIMFWYNDMLNFPALAAAGSSSMRVNGQPVRVDKVDEFTVRYLSPEPHPLLPQLMAGGDWAVSGPSVQGERGQGGYAASRYLQQFHPRYVGEDEANRRARDAGFPQGWAAFLLSRNRWVINPELPLLGPWIVSRPMNQPPWEFTANPYSVWVDNEGNQLPYISEITMAPAQTRDQLVLNAVSGQYDFMDRHLEVAQVPQLVENENSGDYRVHRVPQQRLDAAIRFNLAYGEGTGDPVIGELFRNVDFRRALSLAVDRDQINEAFFLGTSEPTATMVADDNPYFPGPEWRTRWATLDVEQANELLDGIGLTERDGNLRLRPDGNGPIRLDYQAAPGFADFVGMGEMVREHWGEVGIDLTVQEVDNSAILQRASGNSLQLVCLGGGTEEPLISSDGILPTALAGTAAMMGLPYAQWFASNGAQGVEPPPELDALKEAMQHYQEGRRSPDEAERIERGKEILKLHADQVWTIGLAGFGLGVYGVYIAKNNLANVPERVLNGLLPKTPANAYPMTFYYRE